MSKTTAKQTVEAIYEGGILRPLQPLDIPERQYVFYNSQVPGTSKVPGT